MADEKMAEFLSVSNFIDPTYLQSVSNDSDTLERRNAENIGKNNSIVLIDMHRASNYIEREDARCRRMWEKVEITRDQTSSLIEEETLRNVLDKFDLIFAESDIIAKHI